jgi:hypothetical protein
MDINCLNMKAHEQSLHTTVLNCTESFFKEKINKMVLAVTYKKFGKKKAQYYQHNMHNLFVARRLSEDLYIKLLELKNLSNYYVTVDFDMTWDTTGRITGASNVNVCIYKQVGKVTARQLQVYRTTDKVKLEVFISDMDKGSQNLLKWIAEIKKKFGEDTFEYLEHKVLNDADYKRYSRPYNITMVPTVVINDKPFIDPTESQLRSNIEVAINATVLLEGIKLTKMQ